jgi:small conductance mechanosensitive channel
MGTVLAVRPYCHTDHYWQVYFDTNRLITATFGTAGYPPPHVVQEYHTGIPFPAGANGTDDTTVRYKS